LKKGVPTLIPGEKKKRIKKGRKKPPEKKTESSYKRGGMTKLAPAPENHEE